MSNSPQVVDGEASESDTEIEIGRTPEIEIKNDIANAAASVISGEASESEEEDIKPPQQQESPHQLPRLPPQMNMYSGSLLHHRLTGCNISMRRRLEGLGRHTIKDAYEKLAVLNHEMLTVQESMRVADSQINLARAHSREIINRLKRHNPDALPYLKCT